MENKDRLSKVFSMQKQLNEYITTNRHLEFTKEELKKLKEGKGNE